MFVLNYNSMQLGFPGVQSSDNNNLGTLYQCNSVTLYIRYYSVSSLSIIYSELWFVESLNDYKKCSIYRGILLLLNLQRNSCNWHYPQLVCPEFDTNFFVHIRDTSHSNLWPTLFVSGFKSEKCDVPFTPYSLVGKSVNCCEPYIALGISENYPPLATL